MQIDVLAFGAHPDDVELFCGGTLIKLKKQGFTTGIVDLTKGELSTRGDVETRKIEAAKAAEILGVDIRENAGIGDGDVAVTTENKHTVIEIIRTLRPRIVIAPYWEDRHPDHINTSRLVGASFFYAGLERYKTALEAYRPQTLMFYFMHEVGKPTFLVDISQEFSGKMEAIKAYTSQFYNPESKEPNTFISQPEFIDSIKNRTKYFGFQIGVEHAEPFFVKSALKIDNIVEFFA